MKRLQVASPNHKGYTTKSVFFPPIFLLLSSMRCRNWKIHLHLDRFPTNIIVASGAPLLINVIKVGEANCKCTFAVLTQTLTICLCTAHSSIRKWKSWMLLLYKLKLLFFLMTFVDQKSFCSHLLITSIARWEN